MAAPKTLLALYGADTSPSRLEKSALVLIDCQMEYVTGALPLVGIDAALDEAARVLGRARDAGTPVVHVVHRGQPGGAFDADGPGGEVAAQVTPADGEPIVEKQLPNAFANTTLHETLEGLGRKELIVVGFMTHMCVSSTVRAALDLNYRSTVVSGAVATRDLPTTDGGVIDAGSLQTASLAALADRFAVVAASADALFL